MKPRKNFTAAFAEDKDIAFYKIENARQSEELLLLNKELTVQKEKDESTQNSGALLCMKPKKLDLTNLIF